MDTMSYSNDILRDVFDTSEMDVRAKKTIPRDFSLKEEKKAMHNRSRDISSSANKSSDPLYSHNHFHDDPFFYEDAFANKNNPFLKKDPSTNTDPFANKDPFANQDVFPDRHSDEKREGVEMSDVPSQSKPATPTSKPRRSSRKSKSPKWFKEDPVLVLNEVYGQISTYAADSACANNVNVLDEKQQNAILDNLAERAKSWDILRTETEDYEDENTSQIHRLMSWNTHETAATMDTTQSNEMNEEAKPVSSDGDSAKENMEKEKSKKRRVRFDYPIISSLRECPRPDPRDLPNLYFTEEELGQIEDDRESTYIADDVEVVCVPTAPEAPVEVPKTGRGNKHSPPGSPNIVRNNKRYIKSVQIYLRERSRDCPEN